MVVAIVAGVGGYWLLVTALVRRDKGWVGISDLRRATLRFLAPIWKFEAALGAALKPAIERTAAAIRYLGDAIERAGLLEPCPHCGHPPLDHVRRSSTGCIVVSGSLPLRVAVAIPPRYEDGV